MDFSTLDLSVFIGYCCLIVGMGLYVSREKKGKKKTSSDYFLASKALPWWAIGSSLIASNISAEQVIGMSGSGYVLGLGIATYEWMAAATLLIVGKFFLPVFIKKEIYTMPQFLDLRYDGRVRTILAIFWLLVYVFVNLTSVLYLGALAMSTIMGVDFMYAIIGLALFSALYSIYGGLKAVAWTDVIQVIFLIGGGLITTYLAVQAVGGDAGFLGGMKELFARAPEKFDMIFEKGSMVVEGSKTKDAYIDLPGITVLIGGMWITNLYYWGFNQYITQRALAGKSLAEAQKGIVFAGYLKLFMPLIVVIPGIAAFLLMQDGVFLDMAVDGTVVPDKAYPALLNKFVPSGLKGLAFAALIAAIVSSLSSMINSTATIFTMDLYRNFMNKNASETQLVSVGRIVAAVSLVIAIFVAPALENFGQAFQFIQEFTGLVSPGVFVIFMFGLFWKKATANGAFWVAILTLPLSFGIKLLVPGLPFLDRMGIVFLTLSLVMILISSMATEGTKLRFTNTIYIALGIMGGLIVLDLVLGQYGFTYDDALRKLNVHAIAGLFLVSVVNLFRPLKDDDKRIEIDKNTFKTDQAFNIGSIGIVLILVVLYAVFW